MRLQGAAAERLLSGETGGFHAVLLQGADAGHVAEARKRLCERFAHDGQETPTRIDAGALRRDPALLDEALRSRGFFGGRPVVVLEGAKDAAAPILREALEGGDAGDAFLIVTADALPKSSALRTLFESRPELAAVALAAGVPDAAGLRNLLGEAGLQGRIDGDAEALLAEIAAEIDHGAFRRFLETLGVLAAARPIDAAAVASLTPGRSEREVERIAEAVIAGAAGAIGPLTARLQASGAAPDEMLRTTARMLHAALRAATAPGGVEAGLSALRPPVFGPRRHAIAAACREVGAARIEEAFRHVLAAERELRNRGARPAGAIAERCLIRAAMCCARRQDRRDSP